METKEGNETTERKMGGLERDVREILASGGEYSIKGLAKKAGRHPVGVAKFLRTYPDDFVRRKEGAHVFIRDANVPPATATKKAKKMKSKSKSNVVTKATTKTKTKKKARATLSKITPEIFDQLEELIQERVQLTNSLMHVEAMIDSLKFELGMRSTRASR